MIAAKGRLTKAESSIIIRDLEATYNSTKEGMMQQIITYFLETNEYEFFIKRLKNAATTRDLVNTNPEEKMPKTFAPLATN
mgnify:CR=1 FL=1